MSLPVSILKGRIDSSEHQSLFAEIELFFDGCFAFLEHSCFGKEVGTVEIRDLRDDVDKVDAGMELKCKTSCRLQSGFRIWAEINRQQNLCG